MSEFEHSSDYYSDCSTIYQTSASTHQQCSRKYLSRKACMLSICARLELLLCFVLPRCPCQCLNNIASYSSQPGFAECIIRICSIVFEFELLSVGYVVYELETAIWLTRLYLAPPIFSFRLQFIKNCVPNIRVVA